jgi:hypothetical protein
MYTTWVNTHQKKYLFPAPIKILGCTLTHDVYINHAIANKHTHNTKDQFPEAHFRPRTKMLPALLASYHWLTAEQRAAFMHRLHAPFEELSKLKAEYVQEQKILQERKRQEQLLRMWKLAVHANPRNIVPDQVKCNVTGFVSGDTCQYHNHYVDDFEHHGAVLSVTFVRNGSTLVEYQLELEQDWDIGADKAYGSEIDLDHVNIDCANYGYEYSLKPLHCVVPPPLLVLALDNAAHELTDECETYVRHLLSDPKSVVWSALQEKCAHGVWETLECVLDESKCSWTPVQRYIQKHWLRVTVKLSEKRTHLVLTLVGDNGEFHFSLCVHLPSCDVVDVHVSPDFQIAINTDKKPIEDLLCMISELSLVADPQDDQALSTICDKLN